jgi:hypothetical protein
MKELSAVRMQFRNAGMHECENEGMRKWVKLIEIRNNE